MCEAKPRRADLVPTDLFRVCSPAHTRAGSTTPPTRQARSNPSDCLRCPETLRPVHRVRCAEVKRTRHRPTPSGHGPVRSHRRARRPDSTSHLTTENGRLILSIGPCEKNARLASRRTDDDPALRMSITGDGSRVLYQLKSQFLHEEVDRRVVALHEERDQVQGSHMESFPPEADPGASSARSTHLTVGEAAIGDLLSPDLVVPIPKGCRGTHRSGHAHTGPREANT